MNRCKLAQINYKPKKLNEPQAGCKENHTKAHHNQITTNLSEWLNFLKLSVNGNVKQLELSHAFWWGCKMVQAL